MSITVADIKPAVAEAAKLCPGDSRVYDYLNEACERLLWKGQPIDTQAKFAVAVSDSKITWPREIDNILVAAVDTVPVTIRNGWYEFLQHGPGLQDTVNGDKLTLIDRPNSPLQTDIAVASTIRFYVGVAGDANKKILVQGKDANGLEVRTEYPTSSGTYIKGRYMTLGSSGFVATPETWTSITAVQKELTQAPVTVKAYDGSTETTIAIWEPDDLRPEFRRSQLPGASATSTCTLTVVGKLKQVQLRNDTDWVIPANRTAIWQMVKAIWFEKNDDPQKGIVYAQMAKASLDEQMVSRTSGARKELNIGYGNTFGASGVESI